MSTFGTRNICGNCVMNRLTFLCTHPQPLTRRFYTSSVMREKSMSSAKIFWMYLKVHAVYPSSVLRTHWSVNLIIKWHFIYTSCSMRKSQDKFSRFSWSFDIRRTSASTGFQAFEPHWELILVSSLMRVVNIAAFVTSWSLVQRSLNPLNPELNPICYLLALLGAHHFSYVSRIRVKLLTFRLLISYIYGAPILDVSRSHTTTQHSR